ncbi:hypothetical protein VCHA43P277_20288 [Vibrio chagasii]|nr:hypothetical protein VCHA35P150_10202 [Vibrio chagasii]CAH6847899.1 hypothetical protein VCHA37O173_10289 [Vibrio chagasii]CAH6860677.1 hypothetical protein VCHA36P166_10554 [Vibrio chagasii]CAH6887008.1 hypothetical protein VCHA35O142_20367 [Vibrio chagasii]CAH6887393.1 hypothetical protein VCHA29O39_20289 [Vibrio chagasii]
MALLKLIDSYNLYCFTFSSSLMSLVLSVNICVALPIFVQIGEKLWIRKPNTLACQLNVMLATS